MICKSYLFLMISKMFFYSVLKKLFINNKGPIFIKYGINSINDVNTIDNAM